MRKLYIVILVLALLFTPLSGIMSTNSDGIPCVTVLLFGKEHESAACFSIDKAEASTPFYVCRSGCRSGYRCTYVNLHGQTNTAWHGWAITPAFMSYPASGYWVLEYR